MREIIIFKAFVGIVKENVAMMEEQVNQAEKDLGGMKTLKGFLNSIPLFSQVRTNICSSSVILIFSLSIFS